MTRRAKIMTIFGTRPEAIKLSPVIYELERRPHRFETVNVSSGQHLELLRSFIELFRLRVDHDLRVHRHDQQPGEVARIVARRMLPVIDREAPDFILVQGDTSTAVGAATAGSLMRIPVGHVEAGLRSGDDLRPFPEEIHRKRIAELATFHFAPTLNNRRNLLSEGISDSNIFVTGNTVIDSLLAVTAENRSSEKINALIAGTEGLRRIVLTTHRRENMLQLRRTFLALRHFVDVVRNVCVLFPVHPNPSVRDAAEVLRDHPRIRLLEPLDYPDFIQLLQHAWVVLTDSGGIQEEAPTLGKLVLLIRAKTERPEALAAGTVRIAGDSPESLLRALFELKDFRTPDGRAAKRTNPFGSGGSAKAIVDIVEFLTRVGGANEPADTAFYPAAHVSVEQF